MYMCMMIYSSTVLSAYFRFTLKVSSSYSVGYFYLLSCPLIFPLFSTTISIQYHIFSAKILNGDDCASGGDFFLFCPIAIYYPLLFLHDLDISKDADTLSGCDLICYLPWSASCFCFLINFRSK